MSDPSPDPPVFRLAGAGKRFNGHQALAPLDLDIGAGEVLALIGPSGCGKSTAIKLLAGLLAPSQGQVCFHGEDLAGLDIAALRLKLGYVIQQGGLFPHLSARANVTLMADHLGWSADRIKRRVEELADFVHLSAERLDHFPAELSGGQRQRVSLMRALMLEPEVLLLDEPMGALDPMIRHRLQEDLAEVFANVGATVVLVTHDLSEARYLADRIVLLKDGAAIQSGDFDTLLNEPADDFVREFFRAQRGLADA